ncbi:MAG: Hsp20/alpha crystallin family protein [Methylacidiphilales bacterium]|nr:Hsp20/alpha crystallin family protein [Candidatus Methylacidiphilales bacterium]
MNNLLTKKETNGAGQTTPRRTVVPRYQVRENVDAFVLTAWLPGVDRTSLETTVDGETLTVAGSRNLTAPESWTPVYREIPQTDYRLEFELDHRINRDGVRAELSQGVLTLTLPKAEAVKPRRIEIKG